MKKTDMKHYFGDCCAEALDEQFSYKVRLRKRSKIERWLRSPYIFWRHYKLLRKYNDGVIRSIWTGLILTRVTLK